MPDSSNATSALSAIVAGLWRSVEWNQSVPERVRWIEQALALGITAFDHADIYGGYQAEALFGEALRAAPGLRDRLQLVTKCGIRLPSETHRVRVKHYDTSAGYVRGQVEASLRNLATDRLDLVLIHRPDALMDAAALADTFATLTREGKVLHWACPTTASASSRCCMRGMRWRRIRSNCRRWRRARWTMARWIRRNSSGCGR